MAQTMFFSLNNLVPILSLSAVHMFIGQCNQGTILANCLSYETLYIKIGSFLLPKSVFSKTKKKKNIVKPIHSMLPSESKQIYLLYTN